MWGDGTATREYLYVDDAAEVIVLAAECFNKSEPVSTCSASEIGIRDLTATIARLVGFTGQSVWDTGKPNGQPRRKLDTSRAEQEFGFKARTSLDGWRCTIEHYRQLNTAS